VLWTIVVVLLVLWVLGLASGFMLGGLIHVLLAIAIFGVLVNLIRGSLFV
jgi:hypothetical protein